MASLLSRNSSSIRNMVNSQILTCYNSQPSPNYSEETTACLHRSSNMRVIHFMSIETDCPLPSSTQNAVSSYTNNTRLSQAQCRAWLPSTIFSHWSLKNVENRVTTLHSRLSQTPLLLLSTERNNITIQSRVI